MKIPFSSRLPWPSHPNRLAGLLAERRAAGLPTLNLAESNPTRVGLERGAGFLAPLAAAGGLRYAPEPRGLPAAREALAAFTAAANGAPTAAIPAAGGRGAAFPRLGPERFFLCSSTSEAYGWLFKLLCEPGDAVLVPKPGYPLFDFLAGLEAVEARPYRLEYFHPKGWRIDLDSVEEALRGGRVRAIVLIHPNNPTGSYVRAEERSSLVALAARYGAALIVDEVFLRFPVGGRAEASFAGEEGVLTFVLDGLSKLLGAPQLKLGWIAASGPGTVLAEALGRLEIIADTYLSAGTPVMGALPELLAAAPAFLSGLGERLRANLATLEEILGGPDSPHRVLACEGGWTALLEAPRPASEEELAVGLLNEEGLQTHPGYFFDMEREAYFAASLILPGKELAEAARRYRAYFDRLLR
ncbi:MAG: pyridoxal phosphate-dependent aminotransferase [Spirochaetaceae bacterium]|nr:pyridoxal phosphate-dependent aminotransferase [Spirochaetaceae bacterium]